MLFSQCYKLPFQFMAFGAFGVLYIHAGASVWAGNARLLLQGSQLLLRVLELLLELDVAIDQPIHLGLLAAHIILLSHMWSLLTQTTVHSNYPETSCC
jgi:hypothetical protein